MNKRNKATVYLNGTAAQAAMVVQGLSDSDHVLQGGAGAESG